MQVKHIVKTFGPTIALNDVDIEVRAGEIRGLIGENGSGKSTVSSIYAGMQKATSGEMYYLNESWNPSSMVDALAKGVGMIVQETGTVPGITVAENIFLGETSNFKVFNNVLGKIIPIVSNKKMYEEAQKILDEIGASHINSKAITASYDLQDRKLIEIAKIWAKRPNLLIVDETTTALSQKGRQIIYDIIHKLKKANKAVVFISHDMDEIMAVCNVLTVLRDGKIIRTFKKEEFNDHDIRSAMIGREMTGDYYRSDFDQALSTEIAIEAIDIVINDKLKEISLKAHKGEILGIGGLSHCGMHTLGKILFGAIKADSGKVLVYGKNPKFYNQEHLKKEIPLAEEIKNENFAISRHIGYVAKDRDIESLNMQMSIRENVAIAGLDIIQKYGIIFKKNESDYVEKNVKTLSTKCYSIDQGVSQLSGGNKQKVVFAKWLGCESEILILDCPTRGVDIGVKQTMYQLMNSMKKAGKTVIIISEELPELIGMSDRLLIIKDGVITKEFNRSKELKEEDIIEYMI